MARTKASVKSAACRSSKTFSPVILTWISTSPPLEFKVRYALIWKERERQLAHTIIQIAAIALANNLTLVTHNTDEFSHIPHLTLDDWE